MRNCTRDEGRPFEIGNQVLISSHRKLLWSKAIVIDVENRNDLRQARLRGSMTKPLVNVEKRLDDVKPGADPSPRDKLGDVPETAKAASACRRREAQSGSCTEHDWPAMPREKAQAAPTARPKVPMRRRGAHCLVVVIKRGNARGAKGAGHRR